MSEVLRIFIHKHYALDDSHATIKNSARHTTTTDKCLSEAYPDNYGLQVFESGLNGTVMEHYEAAVHTTNKHNSLLIQMGLRNTTCCPSAACALSAHNSRVQHQKYARPCVCSKTNTNDSV